MMDLTTLVRDCSVSGVARRVLLLRADLLPPRLSREHHLRLAHEALEPLRGADRARRYELTHGRLAISWRGDAPDRLRQALDGLEHLLMDAPLDAPTMPELARLFDLPKDGAALIAVAHTAPPETEETAEATPVEAPPRPPLDLATLETIETRLATASVARFARRRAVCLLGSGFSIAWETRFLHVEELMATLCPGRNPYAEPWLFRRLTRSLDRRMLALLSSPSELRQAGPFSLNLNVGGVLSPEFLRFDSMLPAQLRGHTVLDLHPADVMGDLPAFRFAAAFARARGHRVMLRGITPPLLALLDLPALDLDFAELRWAPSLAGLEPSQLRAGAARWVLARAVDDDAIRWGAGMGIGLFQGDGAQPGARVGAGRPAGLARGLTAA